MQAPCTLRKAQAKSTRHHTDVANYLWGHCACVSTGRVCSVAPQSSSATGTDTTSAGAANPNAASPDATSPDATSADTAPDAAAGQQACRGEDT